MSDLISRTAAIDAVIKRDANCGIDSAEVLKTLPPAQPEIIRCKDCIFHGLCRASTRWAVAPKDDWYCADAERRTDE